MRIGKVLAIIAAVIGGSVPTAAQLRGHGGPVRALAVSGDGLWAMSGSFDRSAILWNIEDGTARSVLRFHEGAVNAVAGLAISPDGRQLASASWDGTARVRPVAGGAARLLEGHAGNVNAVAFLPDGRLVSGGYDLTVRIWPTEDGGAPIIATLPSPVNALAITPDGEIAAGCADGIVRMLKPDGSLRAEVELPRGPVTGLVASPDGARLAAATIAGSVAVIDRAAGRILFHLVGPGLPVWSIAWAPDGREILTGGSDRLVRRWNAASGEPIGPLSLDRPKDMLAGLAGSRGAEVFQACAACHTLTPDGGNRAGPTLHGVIGRRIATARGYVFSDALKKLDIVWTPETIGRLFEIGPSRYTPGTNMPEQIVTDEADRAALVAFIEQASRTP